MIRRTGWVYLARHITRPYYKIGYFVCFGQTNRLKRITLDKSLRPNYMYLRPNNLARINSSKNPKRIPRRRQKENIETKRRSHQTKRISSACFVFPTETNTGVRELPESKRPNGTNGRVLSKTIKGGLVGRPPNSLSGLHVHVSLHRIPLETKETSGTLGSEATVRTGSWTKRSFLPTSQGA